MKVETGELLSIGRFARLTGHHPRLLAGDVAELRGRS
jgi:hypothetical protein